MTRLPQGWCLVEMLKGDGQNPSLFDMLIDGNVKTNISEFRQGLAACPSGRCKRETERR